MKNVFTLSGKKKFLVSVIGILAMVAAARFSAYASVIVFIAGVVAAYLAAETTMDRQRAINVLVNTILHNFEKFEAMPPVLSAAVEKAAGLQLRI